jgi:monovalent cation:H+ antiporter-2, CPA2 family
MSSLQNAYWLDDVLVFLVAAGIVVPFLHRARLGSVLGFLLVGVIIGPYGLGRLQYDWHWIIWVTIEDPDAVAPFADWGVVFLLFLIGLEVSVGRLWELRRYVFGAGALQVAVCTVVIAALLHQAGLPRTGSVILGLCLAQSSTAIVMQILVEQGRAATPLGHVALAVLLFQDLMVIPTLFMTGMDHSGGFTWGTLGLTLAQGVAAIIGILLVGQFVLRPLLHLVVKTGSRDLIMAITLLLIVGAAGAAGIAGLSTAFGAFLAGLLLSESEYKHQIEIDLEPFKGLLLGLFFMTVGMLLDPLVLLAHAHLIIAGLVLLLIIKAVGFYLASRIFGVANPIAAELALLLVQAGEFALVTINLARSVGALTEEIAQMAIGIVVLSMVATPLFGTLARQVGARLEGDGHSTPSPIKPANLTNHVIISGFGRVGQVIAKMLESEHVPYVVFDTDVEAVREHHRNNSRVFFGDTSRPQLLDRAGAKHARAFLVTVNSAGEAERMVQAILRYRPDAFVLARAHDAAHAQRLMKLGVTAAVPETVEASLMLGGRALEAMGLPEEAIIRRVKLTRQAEVGALDEPQLDAPAA